MKKLLALILALLMTTFVFTSCHPKAIYYGTFDSSSYEDEIDLFASLNDVEIYIPGIQECQDASDWEYVVKKVSKEWSFVGSQYVSGIWFDEDKEIWLIYICMNADVLDGCEAALIRGEDGRLLGSFTPTDEKEFEAIWKTFD
ncbi:MAG: hypothetical protein J6A68_01470 [Oscillospiraceae bacterium]|nr:hypothetical protein [Oscillospiraceae bacterium]